MAELAIKGHPTRGEEVIKLLEMLGGVNKHKIDAIRQNYVYFIDMDNIIRLLQINQLLPEQYIVYSLEEFEEKFPYKVGDNVTHYVGRLLETQVITNMRWDSNYDCVLYYLDNCNIIKVEDILYKIGSPEDNIPTIQDKTTVETMKEDKGNISDGYHTFNELYEYRLLYNASMFNEFAKQNLYDVHKSKLHSDGTIPFGDENWFVVQAELPNGQISNHYEMKDWDLFQIPIKEKANPYDGHTPHDVAKRLREFLTPKPQYPKTYEECYDILGLLKPSDDDSNIFGYNTPLLSKFQKLLICRDAYWKIAGEQMGLDKPWKPDWDNENEFKYSLYYFRNRIVYDYSLFSPTILAFPTEEMRDAFYENFKDLIESCKELL